MFSHQNLVVFLRRFGHQPEQELWKIPTIGKYTEGGKVKQGFTYIDRKKRLNSQLIKAGANSLNLKYTLIYCSPFPNFRFHLPKKNVNSAHWQHPFFNGLFPNLPLKPLLVSFHPSSLTLIVSLHLEKMGYMEPTKCHSFMGVILPRWRFPCDLLLGRFCVTNYRQCK